MLEFDTVTHTYPDGTHALDRVSLSIGRGLFGLLGPNGAGKSSLMRVAATLQRPSAGGVRFDGIDALAQPRSLRARLGYLPQDFGVYPGVSAQLLLEQIAVLKGFTDRGDRRATAERLLRLVNLWDVRDRAVSTFSGGMRQRWGLAQALIGEPDLLILDEPTAGLDPAERNRLHDLLFGLGERATVIVSTHIVEDVADLCTQLAVLARGRIVAQGSPAELARALDGRVWQGPAEAAGAGAVLLSRRLSVGRRVSRVLADDRPAPGFVGVPATQEDAYFAAIQAAGGTPG
ncbi:ABC transporter ATP-binding protein [Sphingomonas jatrophae]|uniref:ABC-type multidrug transport system, ATPase component n=1 Tax=Sphingomonas jatrophae TaxID=1166337 RepID=A0A1I6KYW8_9SPHN|nr:ABC transporter ATP-binding protein [Sphingomonas jatrophae]SFR96443.1 ABC-type multidrug transport system, ATPase component [Sphingomonas jatrophae]